MSMEFLKTAIKRVCCGFVAIMLWSGPGLNLAQAKSVRLLTEIYPPLQYMENGQLTGIGAEVVRELQKRMGHVEPIEILPWKRGYEQAKNRSGTGLFSMARTPVREDLFQWVGPLFAANTFIFVHGDSKLKISSIDDLAKLEQIVTQAGGANHQYLQSLGLTNVLGVHDISRISHLLLNKRVTAIMSSDLFVARQLQDMGEDYSSIQPVVRASGWGSYIGFSPATSPKVLRRWRTALKSMRDDGTLQRIQDRYLPSSDVWDAPQLEGL
ncbi:MAG: transporter substrate-binding domain-containing protein [Cohaesibacteraceae bacterium]|nr:transporter substrate-binding domain-containing protein [Cohaesibacteraceae bacterium]